MKYIYENIDWEDWNEEEGNTELIFDLDNKSYPPFKNFKINNRVEFIYKNKSYYATVINEYYRKKNSLTSTLIFEFDDCIYSHSAGGKGKLYHCWNYSKYNNDYDIQYLINKLNQNRII
jgi:hypothetical protein